MLINAYIDAILLATYICLELILIAFYTIVAGNLIRILIRDYKDTCKVVGVADGFGVAEDPNGLDPTELLRLVKVTDS